MSTTKRVRNDALVRPRKRSTTCAPACGAAASQVKGCHAQVAATSAFGSDCVLYVARGTIELDVVTPAGPEAHRLLPGDSIVIVAGIPFVQAGTTNNLRVMHI